MKGVINQDSLADKEEVIAGSCSLAAAASPPFSPSQLDIDKPIGRVGYRAS